MVPGLSFSAYDTMANVASRPPPFVRRLVVSGSWSMRFFRTACALTESWASPDAHVMQRPMDIVEKGEGVWKYPQQDEVPAHPLENGRFLCQSSAYERGDTELSLALQQHPMTTANVIRSSDDRGFSDTSESAPVRHSREDRQADCDAAPLGGAVRKRTPPRGPSVLQLPIPCVPSRARLLPPSTVMNQEAVVSLMFALRGDHSASESTGSSSLSPVNREEEPVLAEA